MKKKKTDFTFQEDISNVSQHIIRIWKLSQNRGSQSQNIDEPKTKKKEKEQEVIDISQVKKMFPKKAELKTLIDNSKQCTLKKGDIIVNQGTIPQPMVMFILEGSVEVTKDFGDGVFVLLEVMKSPASFGHSTYFLRGQPLNFRLSSNEDDTLVAIVDGYYLDTLFHHDKYAAAKYFHLMSQQLSTNISNRERALIDGKTYLQSSKKKNSFENIKIEVETDDDKEKTD